MVHAQASPMTSGEILVGRSRGGSSCGRDDRSAMDISDVEPFGLPLPRMRSCSADSCGTLEVIAEARSLPCMRVRWAGFRCAVRSYLHLGHLPSSDMGVVGVGQTLLPFSGYAPHVRCAGDSSRSGRNRASFPDDVLLHCLRVLVMLCLKQRAARGSINILRNHGSEVRSALLHESCVCVCGWEDIQLAEPTPSGVARCVRLEVVVSRWRRLALSASQVASAISVWHMETVEATCEMMP